MKNFNLSIVTPEGSLFEGECYQVEAPGSEGVFGVLANHMNMVAELKPGLVTIHEQQSEQKYVVADGIAEVDSKRCVILVEKAIALAQVDLEKIKSTREKLNHDLQKAESETLQVSLLKERLFLDAVIENCNNAT